MILDIICRWIIGRITGHVVVRVVGVLIHADIVEAHRRRHCATKSRHIQLGETSGHAKVKNHSHGLGRDWPLAYVAVWSDRSGVHHKSLVLANIPCDRALVSRIVLKCVVLVLFPVIPVVV